VLGVLSLIPGWNLYPSGGAATRHSGFICPATVCLLFPRSAPILPLISSIYTLVI
jgi:hypothetical protein